MRLIDGDALIEKFNEKTDLDTQDFKYCPNCGAKMDE